MKENAPEEKWVLGFNYWPAARGVSWWREFELSEVKKDLALAAEYGLDLIRIFLLWEDFQPEINRVSVKTLEGPVRVADPAQDRRIKILPVFFCGHTNGVNWLPSWMVERGRGEGRAAPLLPGHKLALSQKRKSQK